jgi:roadblock/LC7 domain-containing protein
VVAATALVACGGGGSTNNPPPPDGPPPDAAGPPRIATGTRIVDHTAVVGGLTSDGYVVYSDLDASGHSVAKVIPIAGGTETVIATSAGTGKSDIRFEVQGSVVFAWVDRGSRVASLSVWSQASGVVALGPNIRPGRASASADGKLIAYERDITDTTGTLVGGPIAGPATMIAMSNAQDDDCWRDTDIASVNPAAPHLLVRYCPAGATAFTMRSIAADGTMTDLSTAALEAAYGASRAIWRETGGALVTTSDGVTVETLAPAATSFAVSHDASAVAYLTSDGMIYAMPSDHSAAAHPLVAAPAAATTMLGTLSGDGQSVLYSTMSEARNKDDVAPYTDVQVAGPAGTRALVPGTTSCPGCLYDSFTPDGHYALVLDPIDNSQAADGEGPIKVLDLDDGSTVTSFGTAVYTAFALGGAGTGTSSRFMFVDAVADASYATGWIYGMTTRDLTPSAMPATVASGAENFAIDLKRGRGVVSFNGTDDTAGLWAIALQ